jgi:cytochrome c551/c552
MKRIPPALGPAALFLLVGAAAAPQEADERATQRAARQAAIEAEQAEFEARVARHGGFVASEAELLDAVAEHTCFACHGGLSPAQRVLLDERDAPRLAGATPVGERVDRAWLQAFLADPRGTRAHTPHPHELAALPDVERAAVAANLAAFLTEGAAPDTLPSTSSAAELERGRRLLHTVGCVACHVPEEPADDLEWTLADWNRFDEAPQPEAETPAEAEVASEAANGAPDPASTYVQPGTLAPGDQPFPPDLATKYSRESLAAFLADPLAVRPAGHMPDMALGLADARAIAAYLLRDAVMVEGGRFSEAPGLLMTAETHTRGRSAATPGDLPEPATTETRVVDVVDLAHKPSDERFVLRYDGILSAPVDGSYTFHLRSDDGTWLDIDGARVIDNGGDHAPQSKSAQVTLTAGAHTFGLVMYERSGGEELTLEWETPDAERGPLPAEVFTHWAVQFPGLGATASAGDAARGRVEFMSYGCAACHTDVDVGDAAPVEVARPRVCLDFGGAVSAVPARYELPHDFLGRWTKDGDGRWAAVNDWRGANGAAESGAPDVALPRRAMSIALPRLAERLAVLEAWPEARAAHVMEQRSCLTCHRRGDVGGVHPERRAFFLGDERAELGDEGRYPPHLTRVGRKLNDESLLAALVGDVRARPYTTTRMPKFGADNVNSLARDLAEADRAVVDGMAELEAPASLPPNAIQLGRRLAGNVDGLGCVQCHDFLGTPSLGVRAVDLGQMHTRIRWPWFRDLLVDPTSVNMNTRMTAVFVDGKSPVHDVYGGDPEQQVAALWAFLAQGDNMAPPPGIRTGEAAYEIEPLDRVRMVGVFMRDVSPKVLCVGTPAGVHFAWDMQNARLAKVWRGRFLNARGTWEGRAGALESPPSSDVFEPCADSAVAYFDPPEAWTSAPWPRETGAMSFRGTGGDTFVFSYRVDGNVVTELLYPFESDGEFCFRRVINLAGSMTHACVRIARGDSIELDETPHASGAQIWRIGGPRPHTVLLTKAGDTKVVDVDGARELRVLAGVDVWVTWSTQW